MQVTKRFQAALQGFKKANNSVGDNIGRRFLRYGNRRPAVQDWAQIVMAEEDKYTGYMYGAIEIRANLVAELGEDNLVTKASKKIVDDARNKDVVVEHPYLTKIDESPDFSNIEFWHDISSFLDLKGVAYVMALRNINGSGTITGDITKFSVLNPYDITVVRNQSTMEVEGYVETQDGRYRQIPPHMVIPIRKFYPFSRDKTFGVSDAAKDAQFNLKQASDQMRGTIGRNNKFPGAVMVGDSEIALDEETLKNFKARMLGTSGDGEPIFVSGQGTFNWQDMQIDLRKSAPDIVNETNINLLSAVTGVSKTNWAIEQSGTTRDTASIQKDLLIGLRVIPQLRLIVDALNQDYKRHYPAKYKDNQYRITIDSPLAKDREAEMKDVEIRDKNYDVFQKLVEQGYDRQIAAQYANGDISLDELGDPTQEVINPSDNTSTNDFVLTRNAATRKEITSYDYPEVYESLGIDMDNLGFVMLDIEPFDVSKYVTEPDDELYYSEDENSYKKGAVAEKTAHMTLMFGLMENANNWKREIDMVLESWNLKSIEIESISYFEAKDGEGVPIIAHIKMTNKILEGNKRLKLLPHINTFPDYRPHVTLAYVKNDKKVIDKWVKSLSDQFKGKKMRIKDGVNYGEQKVATNCSSDTHNCFNHAILPVVKNQFEEESQGLLNNQQAALQNAIVNIEEGVVMAVLNKVTTNAFESQSDIISDQERRDYEDELEMALAAFYGVILPLYANSVLGRRASEFGLGAVFKLNNSVKENIRELSEKAAKSHINTILDDLLSTVQSTYDKLVKEELTALLQQEASKLPEDQAKELLSKPVNKNSDIYKLAEKKALEGNGQQQIVSAIKSEYKDISTNRAKTIARTETARAFTQSQYEADVQFIKQNSLEGRAYKKWVTRSGNPCALCLNKASEPPIPFEKAFANLGDELTATYEVDGRTKVLKQKITYETIQAGNLHPNCSCIYQLIIEQEP